MLNGMSSASAVQYVCPFLVHHRFTDTVTRNAMVASKMGVTLLDLVVWIRSVLLVRRGGSRLEHAVFASLFLSFPAWRRS